MKVTQKILSRENQKLKLARKVREGKAENCVFIEGVRLAKEILGGDLVIKEAFFNENFGQTERERELIIEISAKCASVSEIADGIFQTIADTNQSQGIILITEKPESGKNVIETRLANNRNKPVTVVFLHEINNPSNLGAILRTAEASGAAGVITSEKSADVFSAKAVRAGMGANLRLPIWENAGFEEVLMWAKTQNLVSTAADVNAEKTYTEIDWKTPRLLIFGSEAHGLSENQRAKIEEIIFIPMENEVESLNLAVSCGIILFEAKRQRNFS